MANSFSVIVPAFNCEKVISRTLESIIKSIEFFYQQSDRHQDVKSELIVVNDCSTDNTLYIISQFVGKNYPFNYKIVNHPIGRGAGATRNTGVKNSQGELLFFCDGDDLYLPEHISVCFMMLNHQPQAKTDSPSYYSFINTNNQTINVALPAERLDGIRTAVKIEDEINPSWKKSIENTLTINLCIRRECHEFIEGYPEDLVYKKIGGREDCAYQECLVKFFKVAKIELETAEYMRYPGNSLDRQIKRFQSAREEQYEIAEEEYQLHVDAKELEDKKLSYLIDKKQKLNPMRTANQSQLEGEGDSFKQIYQEHCQLKGYQFTQDLFSLNIPLWQRFLKRFANLPQLHFLEIGSWEGRSTCWLLDNILTDKSSKITCVDTFAGNVEYAQYKDWDRGSIKSIEDRFDFNVTRTGALAQVEKLVGVSQNVLRSLPLNTYDFIYIDGSHFATDVLEDALLCWRLAKVNALIIFDDYNVPFSQNPTQNAKLGIDAFLSVFKEKINVLHIGHQVVVEKIEGDREITSYSNLEKTAGDRQLISLSNSEKLKVKVRGCEYDFLYPKYSCMVYVVSNVLQGKDYPIVNLPGYVPTTILDIGANVGATALYFYNVYPSAKLYCFEPSLENFAYLEENTKYFNNIQVFPYGLFEQDCEMPLYKGATNTAQNTVMASREASKIAESIKLVKTSNEMKRLNLTNISILKIDTEGCEVPIILEIFSVVQNIDIIYLEYHSEEDRREIDRLFESNFVLCNMNGEDLHRGTCVYLSKKLGLRYPEIDNKRIRRISL